MNIRRTTVTVALSAAAMAGMACSVLADEPHTSPCGHAKALRGDAPLAIDPELPWVAKVLREAMSQTDVLHNDLDIEVLPSSRSIVGSNTMTVKSLTDGLTQFSFRLHGNHTIASCVLNGGTPAPVQLIGTTGRVVTLDRPYNVGETFTLKVSYFGAPPRVDSAITFATQDGLPHIFTFSEPFGSSAWWPCKDVDYGQMGDNSDKARLDIAITVPSTISAVANGMPVAVEDVAPGKKRYRWSTAYELPSYLVCFSAGKYNTWSTTFDHAGRSMPVQFSIYSSQDSPVTRADAETVVPMLGVFSDLFGLYPFIDEKYGIYQFGGGGMEHTTYSGQCCFYEDLNSHELAHQWWGDWVTCKTWSDIWLNEGFATYAEALWLERKPGSSGFQDLRAAMNNRRPPGVAGTVYRYSTGSYGQIFTLGAYNKGAWVLHMLRGVIGDQAFFDTLAAYRNAYGNSTATTDDFAAMASSVSGVDLSRFFEQWVYKGGAVNYASGFENVAIAGRNYVRLHVRQTQSDQWGVGGVFAMPVTVGLGTGEAAERARLLNAARLQHFLVPVGSPAASVVVDPDDYILTVAKTSEAYIPGSPKIVETIPAPGEQVPPSTAISEVVIQFSDGVVIDASDITVEGPRGPVPFTFSYDESAWRARLDLGSDLPWGSYAVTVSDHVRSAAGASLDGELSDPHTAMLPSGDGLPGGSAVLVFRVEAAGCEVDVNDDGIIDFVDYLDFLTKFDAGDLAVDFTHDGMVDFSDYLEFLAVFEAGC